MIDVRTLLLFQMNKHYQGKIQFFVSVRVVEIRYGTPTDGYKHDTETNSLNRFVI